jgi:hypothetical protein
MTTTQLEAIRQHGLNLLAIFPRATERDPVALCKRLRRLEAEGSAFGLRLCNGPEFPSPEAADAVGDAILRKVNKLLGNVREYQPKTGAKCGCRRGVQRDNCSTCEATGLVVDFHRIRTQPATVPVFLNRDPRGYALKIDDEWMRSQAHPLHRDWGGYGIIAPEIE